MCSPSNEFGQPNATNFLTPTCGFLDKMNMNFLRLSQSVLRIRRADSEFKSWFLWPPSLFIATFLPCTAGAKVQVCCRSRGSTLWKPTTVSLCLVKQHCIIFSFSFWLCQKLWDNFSCDFFLEPQTRFWKLAFESQRQASWWATLNTPKGEHIDELYVHGNNGELYDLLPAVGL